MNDRQQAEIIAKLNEAQRAITEARALLIEAPPPYIAYQREITTALQRCGYPMTMSEIVEATKEDYASIGVALTKLYRTGILTRQRIRKDESKRTYYAYALVGESGT